MGAALLAAVVCWTAAGAAPGGRARGSLPPSPPPLPAPAPGLALPASARLAAERLADGLGVPREGHDLFRENLARYLFNGYADAELARLSARPALKADELPEAPRWKEKLQRDAAAPYSDAQVYARLRELERELEAAEELLKRLKPGGEYALRLMGGVLRGRASAHSDLDVILLTEDQELFAAAMSSPYGYLVKEKPVVLSPPPHNRRARRALGPMLELGEGPRPRPAGWLTAVFESGRRRAAGAALEREIPLENLEVWTELKKLSKKRLRHPPGDPRREAIEARMRRLARQLEPPNDEAPGGVSPEGL